MGTVPCLPHHSREIPVVILNTGARVSALGFGGQAPESVESFENAVVSAIKMGYRHFETAASYETEAAIGRGLHKAFSSGLVKREDVFVTFKFEDVDAAEVGPAIKKSLSVLQLEYLDLCLVQSPLKLRTSCTFPPKRREDVLLSSNLQHRWEALEDCAQVGLTKAIGVSNFSVKKLKALLEHAKVIPAVNQVELHPMWQQTKLVEFCRSVGVRVSSWHPLGGQLPLSAPNNAIIKDIAEKHRKTPSQIALRWIIESGFFSVVSSYNPETLLEYISIFDFKLTAEDLDRIATIDRKGLPSLSFVDFGKSFDTGKNLG